LQRVHHEQLSPRNDVERGPDFLEVIPEERSHQERIVAEPDRGRTYRGPARVVQATLPQVIDRGTSLQRERSLQYPLGAHLPREIQRRDPRTRRSDGNAKAQSRFAAAHVSGENYQILAPESPGQHAVE
jgi:hypothetical protein